jgi:hypothetical protein
MSDMRHKINQAMGLLTEVLLDLEEPDEKPHTTIAELVTVPAPPTAATIKACWAWFKVCGGGPDDWKYCCELAHITSTKDLTSEQYQELSKHVCAWVDKFGKREVPDGRS